MRKCSFPNHLDTPSSEKLITLGENCFGYRAQDGTFCLMESGGDIVRFPGESLGRIMNHPKVNGFAEYGDDDVLITNTSNGLKYYFKQDTVFHNRDYRQSITVDLNGCISYKGVTHKVRWIEHVRGGRGGNGIRMGFGARSIGSIVLGGNCASDMSYEDKYKAADAPPQGDYTISKVGVNVMGILGKPRMWLVSSNEEYPYGRSEWSDVVYDAQIKGFISSEGYFDGYSIHMYGYTNTYGHKRKLDNGHIWQQDKTLFVDYTWKLMLYRCSLNWPLANSWIISSASDVLAYRIDNLDTDLPMVTHPIPLSSGAVYWGRRYYTYMNNPVSGWTSYGSGSCPVDTVCQDCCIYAYNYRDYFNRQYTKVNSFAVGSNTWTDPFKNPYLCTSIQYPYSQMTAISRGLIAIANDYCVDIYQLPNKEASYQIVLAQPACAIAIYNKRIVIVTQDSIEVHKLYDEGGSLNLVTIDATVNDVAIHENIVAWTGDEGTEVLLGDKQLIISVDPKSGRHVEARNYRVLVSSLYTNEVDLYEVVQIGDHDNVSASHWQQVRAEGIVWHGVGW